MQFNSIISRIRERHPLIECLTNYVTINDVANIILACGASPVMGMEAEELPEFIGLSSGVVINLGTISRDLLPAFEIAFKSSAEQNKPVVFDPVGVGATELRTSSATKFLELYPVSVIRGNASEISCLAGAGGKTQGVDAASGDAVTPANRSSRLAVVQSLARRYNCVVAMSGALDIISDGTRNYLCRNGVPDMSRVTGTGCQLTGLTAACVAAMPEEPLLATVAATAIMGIAGELAADKCRQRKDGTSSLRNYLIDAVSMMDDAQLENFSQIESID